MVKAKITEFWSLCRFYLCWLFRVKGYGISVIVPLNVSGQDDQRARNWRWLERYWRANLRAAEIVIGRHPEAAKVAFSKSIAVNNGASKAHGNVFVIVDADIYISVESVLRCAKEIRLAEEKSRRLWLMPYREAFRLTKEASERILNSDPRTPLDIRPLESEITNIPKSGNKTPPSRIAHWYGAMAQIVSRQAFYTVGGWDPRMTGWGGEDHAAMAAMDTLYAPHKTLSSKVIHIWHPVLVPGSVEPDPKAKKRLWANQDAGASNNALSIRYYAAYGKPHLMRSLVDEFLKPKTSAAVNSVDRAHPCEPHSQRDRMESWP